MTARIGKLFALAYDGRAYNNTAPRNDARGHIKRERAMKFRVVGMAVGVAVGLSTFTWAQQMGATATLKPTAGNTAEGTVTFTPKGDKVTVVANVTGLSPGPHGFHVHEKGDCSASDGMSAGGHFNPTTKPHGEPTAPDHHAADCLARLGPVKALRFASTPRGGACGLDRALGRAMSGLLSARPTTSSARQSSFTRTPTTTKRSRPEIRVRASPAASSRSHSATRRRQNIECAFAIRAFTRSGAIKR